MMLMGCNSLTPEQFTNSGPVFDPLTFFAGRMRSQGVFENRAGEPSQRFTTVSIGRREGNTLLLEQERAKSLAGWKTTENYNPLTINCFRLYPLLTKGVSIYCNGQTTPPIATNK